MKARLNRWRSGSTRLAARETSHISCNPFSWTCFDRLSRSWLSTLPVMNHVPTKQQHMPLVRRPRTKSPESVLEQPPTSNRDVMIPARRMVPQCLHSARPNRPQRLKPTCCLRTSRTAIPVYRKPLLRNCLCRLWGALATRLTPHQRTPQISARGGGGSGSPCRPRPYFLSRTRRLVGPPRAERQPFARPPGMQAERSGSHCPGFASKRG